VWPAQGSTSPPTTSSPARAESLAADGVKPATSIGDAAGGADVLVVMVATPDQVESVLFGDDPARARSQPARRSS
jgi:3-hydroxyisobutyrate dehydrogenase/putative dehydrogenase